jgi:long-subunit fatty acid transport protein
MKPSSRLLGLGFLFTALAVGNNAVAQGIYSGTKGARVAGRAGAFVAKADDLLAMEYNPAGLAKIDGWVVQLSNRFSYNQIIFDRSPAYYGSDPVEFYRVRNEQPFQGIDPFLSIGSDFGLDDWGFGLSFSTPPGIGRVRFPEGGMLPEDRPEGAQRYMMVSRDAQIVSYSVSAAYKFNDLFGLGVTAQWLHVPRLEYSLVVSPVVNDSSVGKKNAVRGPNDSLSTVSGSDPFIPSLIFGGWVKPTAFLEAGLSLSVPIGNIATSSQMSLERVEATPEGGIGHSDIPLSRDGVPANDVRVFIPLPMLLRAGLRYIHKRGEDTLWDIEFDVSYQGWSRAKNFTVESNGLVATDQDFEIPVGTVQLAKEWKDSFTLALGGDVVVIPKKLTFRGGLGYESAVSDPAYQHVDFPTGQHLNGALGASVQVGIVELALSYGYRYMLPVSVSEAQGRVYQQVPTPADLNFCPPPYDAANCPYPGQPSATVNAGNFQASSHQVSVDGVFRF